MDFETYKKTKLATSGICPKCVKHFDRLRTHANACLKNIYQNYLSSDSNNIAKDEEQSQLSSSIQSKENEQIDKVSQKRTSDPKTKKKASNESNNKDELVCEMQTSEANIDSINKDEQVKEIKISKSKLKVNKEISTENNEPNNKVKETKVSKSKLPKLNKENSSTQLVLESNENKIDEVKITKRTESKILKKSDKESIVENSKPVDINEQVVEKPSVEIESNKENSLVTSKIKIDHSKQTRTESDLNNKEKFHELYEKVIDGLKNQTISNGQYRFDFVKLTLDVKVVDKNNKPLQAIENSNNDKPIQSIPNQTVRNLSKQTNQKITPVLFVTNLDSNSITVDNLFILFGVYGDVVRIKILDKKLAFIEFINKEQAEIALDNLDNCKFYDQVMRVYSSVYETVSMNHDNGRQCIVKDFTNSHLHRYRFRKPDAHHFINRPSPTLHLSNIPVNVSENEINYLFEQYGVVRALKFDPNHPNRALIQMKSVDEAVIALVKMHGKQLNKNLHLRCNFHGRNLL